MGGVVSQEEDMGPILLVVALQEAAMFPPNELKKCFMLAYGLRLRCPQHRWNPQKRPALEHSRVQEV